MSLRLRVALLATIAVALVELAIVASVYAYASERLYAKVEDDLRGTAARLIPIIAGTGDLPPGATTQTPGQPPYIPRLVSADGRNLTARGGPDVPITERARAVASGATEPSLETIQVGADNYYVFTVSVGQGRALQISHSLAAERDVLNQLLAAAIVAALVGLVAAPLAGATVATVALAPLRRLSRVAEQVTTTGDLTARVSVGGGDELATFARSFDAMLDRLAATMKEVEQARRSQRQLVADASHELRAPLATLRANIELLGLGSDAPIGDRQQLIADTIAGIEDLTTLVGQLIELAREDERVHERVPVRLDQLVAEEVDRMRQRYPNVEFLSDLDPTTVTGDGQALSRAIANLVDNAGKWSPPRGVVHIHLHGDVLEVRDEGPGIDAADLPHVFERFYRGSRSAAVPGSGLGLAIVAQVMRSHGGEVTAEPQSTGGTLFRARFVPAAS